MSRSHEVERQPGGWRRGLGAGNDPAVVIFRAACNAIAKIPLIGQVSLVRVSSRTNVKLPGQSKATWPAPPPECRGQEDDQDCLRVFARIGSRLQLTSGWTAAIMSLDAKLPGQPGEGLPHDEEAWS